MQTIEFAMLDFQGRMLHRVLDICGGFAAARSRLAVSEHALRLWLDGRARLPERVFLRAADIVLEDDIARASSDRRRAPRVGVLEGSAANDAVHRGERRKA
ncbi:MAG TPA: hypothetical protein VI454_02335 [Verrucomicrobiae bacterium]